MNPRVSAIVTTCNRPHLVVQAIRSVLAQTLPDLEVVVVVDGPEAATERTLAAIEDPRVRVHVRPTRGGQGAAVNSGIALARGEWTAILDDDDEWLPEKLEQQLRTAEACDAPNPVVACRFLARSEKDDVLWPRRPPRSDEPVCEYLFCRHSLAFGEGIIPTSMIFARTALFRALPLDEHLRRHCDLDWLTRADHRDDVKVLMPPGDRPLAIWQMQQERSRMSNNHDWRDSFAWLQGARERISARAYAGFLLTWVSFSARREHDLGAFAFLVREAFAHGRPSAMELAIHTAIWAVPDALRQRLSRALATAHSV
jgi:glycosyltransferase involved in cell wall biosynthesis